MDTRQEIPDEKMQLLQAGMAKLKLEFIETTRMRVASLDGLMDELYEPDADVGKVVDAICQHAHKLHGQAGAFGFPEIGAQAARLEKEIIDARDSAPPLNTETVEAQLVNLLDQIEASLDAG